MKNITPIIGAIVGAIIGAAIFAGVAMATEYIIGFIAIISGGIAGAGAGFAAKISGNRDGIIQIIGAIGGLVSVILGYFIFYQMDCATFEGITLCAPAVVSFVDYMKDFIEPMDILFAGLGVYGGYAVAGWLIAQEEEKIEQEEKVE